MMYKVLLVDDEPINYQLFEKLVPWEEKGFQIVGTASDGLTALKQYEELSPDLIFMDIQMPLMDGLECVQNIRSADEKVQIVIVSAYGDFSYAQKAIRYGVQDFLLKPVSRLVLNQLVDKMKGILDRGRESESKETMISADQFYQASDGAFFEELQEKCRIYKAGSGQQDQSTPVDLPSLIRRAVLEHSEEMVSSYLAGIFLQAYEEKKTPELLKEEAFDLLIQIKFVLKQLEKQDSFSILRNIRSDSLDRIDSVEDTYRWMEDRIHQTFEEIREICFGSGRRLVLRTNALVLENYQDSSFSVQNAADYNGVSKNYFTALYKEQAGIGFWEYVTRIRIEKARELLLSTDELVSTVSQLVGYESEYHFSRKFKEYTGESPNQYRRSHREQR